MFTSRHAKMSFEGVRRLSLKQPSTKSSLLANAADRRKKAENMT